MNCLNRNEIQEYIDNEIRDSESMLVSDHINSCAGCKKQYLELLEDIKFIKETLDVFEIEPKYIPSIENYMYTQKTKRYGIPIFLKTAAAILIIAISISISLTYFQQPEKFTENEMMFNNFMNSSDPNEQWRDNQMLITISNDKNEIVFSFLMDNKD